MVRIIAWFVIGFILLGVAGADAGQFNQTLSIGDKAPEWKDLPGTDGQKHSLADLKDKQAVVVVFTCNSCP
ncbi:MAG TPA: thioredoxin family protein, partial [Pirellulales bacterium]|nr:thioredoxin family protein [Pirellulales bacterium]